MLGCVENKELSFTYRPLARPWECDQSEGQNNKIFLHENRSQFQEENISFVLPPRLAAFP